MTQQDEETRQWEQFVQFVTEAFHREGLLQEDDDTPMTDEQIERIEQQVEAYQQTENQGRENQ